MTTMTPLSVYLPFNMDCLRGEFTPAKRGGGGPPDGTGRPLQLAQRPMADFDTPTYNADVQDTEGFPSGAEQFRDCIQANDAFVISSPEYNASMPGGLKNSIDWVSRFSPQPFNEKHCLLLSASPSMVGGNRGLWALRMPLEHLGVRVYPDMFSLAQAHQAFGEDKRTPGEYLNAIQAAVKLHDQAGTLGHRLINRIQIRVAASLTSAR